MYRRLSLAAAGSLLAAAAVLLALGAGGSETARALANCETSNAALDSSEQQLAALINEYRQANGLSALSISPNLSRAAAWMADDLTRDGYFNHYDNSRPGGRSPFERVVDCGYGSSNVGEILAISGSPASALAAWKTSPGHNGIILKANWAVMGVGHYGSVWGVAFGTLNDSTEPFTGPPATATPAKTATPAPSPRPAAPVMQRRALLQMVSTE